MLDIHTYLQKLLTEAGFELDDPERPELVADLEPMLVDHMHIALLDALDESTREIALDMLEAGKIPAFMKFCQEKIATYDAVITMACQSFSDEYLASFDEEDEEEMGEE